MSQKLILEINKKLEQLEKSFASKGNKMSYSEYIAQQSELEDQLEELTNSDLNEEFTNNELF